MIGMKLEIDLIHVVLLIGGIIIYAVRVEFITKQNKKDIEILWTKHDDLSANLTKEISEMSKALSRIEGFLAADKKKDS